MEVTSILVFFCSALIAAVFGIATSAIAIECFDKNQSFKDSKKDNYVFLIVNLVFNIIMTLVSLSFFYSVAMS
jgi:surface polysaccharide O-acyltransferase-like enzyme